MDATVQVALVGIITTIVTTTGVVLVAFVNNRRERGGSAESALERTLRERVILRDEQIEDLRAEVNDQKGEILARDMAIKARDKVIVQLREENELHKEGRL